MVGTLFREVVAMFSWRRTTRSSPTGQGDRVHAFHQLLDCARRGDSEALSVRYREFLSGGFAYIAARIPDRTTAEHLTSEVFLTRVEGVSTLRDYNHAHVYPCHFETPRLT